MAGEAAPSPLDYREAKRAQDTQGPGIIGPAYKNRWTFAQVGQRSRIDADNLVKMMMRVEHGAQVRHGYGIRKLQLAGRTVFIGAVCGGSSRLGYVWLPHHQQNRSR